MRLAGAVNQTVQAKIPVKKILTHQLIENDQLIAKIT